MMAIKANELGGRAVLSTVNQFYVDGKEFEIEISCASTTSGPVFYEVGHITYDLLGSERVFNPILTLKFEGSNIERASLELLGGIYSSLRQGQRPLSFIYPEILTDVFLKDEELQGLLEAVAFHFDRHRRDFIGVAPDDTKQVLKGVVSKYWAQLERFSGTTAYDSMHRPDAAPLVLPVPAPTR